jgi:hypothetical protein
MLFVFYHEVHLLYNLLIYAKRISGPHLVKFNIKISLDWQEPWHRLNRELNFVLIHLYLKATVMLIFKCPPVKLDLRLQSQYSKRTVHTGRFRKIATALNPKDHGTGNISFGNVR